MKCSLESPLLSPTFSAADEWPQQLTPAESRAKWRNCYLCDLNYLSVRSISSGWTFDRSGRDAM